MNLHATRSMVLKKFPFINQQKISQSFLRSEADLSDSTKTIEFSLQKNSLGRTPYGSENLISNNDLFVMTHMKIGIYKIGSGTPTDAQRGAAIPYCYVNTNTGLFDGSDDANLQAVFNGKFSLTMDEITYITGIHTSNFERVPTSQQGTTTAAFVNASSADATYTLIRDGKPNSLYGFYQTDFFVLNGQSTVTPKITLPASYNLAESSETNTAVLEIKGFRIVNGAIEYQSELADFLATEYGA